MRLEKECPRCKGQIGFWRDGIWYPCITCKTLGKVKVASEAEYRRLKHMVENPEKVKTKQRERS